MAGFFDESEDTTSPVETSFFDEPETEISNTLDPSAGDFSQGIKRGVQNLQAMTYGAGALTGSGLKKMGAEFVGQKLQDVGMEGYNRNVEEAKLYPKKHSFKDIYTGEAGVGGAIDWVQGTLGELVPSMVEAAGGAAIGTVIGGGPVGTAVGGFAGRTIMKKGIEKSLQQALKKGIGKQTEAEVRKQITKQAMKKLGGKAGIGAAVMPMESGGMYADLLENKGIDAPETAMLFGALATSLEFIGGNSKLVDTFVDALGSGSAGMAKKTAKELLSNIPQEALQEGSQEALGILNDVVNTDDDLLTKEHLETIIESMAAGAVGGGAGALVSTGMNQGQETTNKTPQEQEADRRAKNILTQDEEGITESIQSLNTKIQLNDSILNGTYQEIDAKAAELNITSEELIKQTLADNKAKKSLITKITAKDKAEYDKLSPEDKAVKNITDRLQNQRDADEQKFNQELDKPVDELAVDNFLDDYAEGQTGLRDDTITRNRQQQFEALKTQILKDQETNAETPETRERRLAFETLKKDDLTQQEQELIDRNLALLEVNRISTPEETAAVLEQVNDETPQADVPEILDASQSAETFLADNFTERESALIENYWQGVKQELNLRQEEMTPGTEAAMKKKFFETKLAEIEGNVVQDTQAQTSPEEIATIPLSEQNKRQAWFQQTAKELGDFPTTNPQKITREQPRTTQPFKNEQGDGTLPQFQTTENQEVNENLNNEPIVFTSPEGQSNTSLGNILDQVKTADGLTGQLANFLGDFIAESKLDTNVIIDPEASSASYIGGDLNTITLKDSSQLATSLHEITHAVTVREMKANKEIRDQVNLLMKRIEAKVIKEAILTPAQIKLLKSARTSQDFKKNLSNEFKYDNVAYGLLNENEFLAQAMGNEQFQRVLKATTIADNGVLRNAWDAFIEIIMKTLGIQQTHQNAFGETLSIIAKLAQQENVNQETAEINESFSPDQRLPQAEYDSVRDQKNNLVKGLAQQARMKLTETRLLADKALGSISTRLKNVDPELSAAIRELDWDTGQKVLDVLKEAKKVLDITHGTKNKLGIRQGGMTAADKSDWDWARLNSDEGKIEQLSQKYNMTDQLAVLREKMNQLRKDAVEVGYDVGFIEEYWPRVINDREGFLQATEGISQDPVFSNAIRDAAKKLGVTQEEFERDFPEVKADIISNLILGNTTGIGGPGNIQQRVFETIPKEYAPFYMDADAALMQYVYSMTKKIETRKFFGKVPKRISDLKASKKQKQADLSKFTALAELARADNPEALAEHTERMSMIQDSISLIDEKLEAYKARNNYTENIGSYIDRMMVDGRIQKKDEKMVRDILDARFHEHGTTGIVNAYKNLSYIDTMGSPLSAITQIGDLAWAMYVGKVWTPKGFVNTGKNLAKAIAGTSEITKEDLGIERIAQEFADGTTLSKAVSKVFKVVGLEKIDSIGKEVLINNALAQYKAEARENPAALEAKIRPTFKGKSADVVQELLSENPSDNVKMMLYSRLLDFQPVALSEMPEIYLNSGNGRVFYMLKTYTIKQFDVFRKEVVHNLKSDNPQQKLQGIKNMVQLMALLTIANATADEMKDFMLGKETKFSDNVIENFLTMGGASRFTRMQVSKDGFGSALTQQILPPTKFVNAASKDMAEGYKNHVSGDTSNFDHMRTLDSLPVAGKLLYWHYGRGSDQKKSIDEQEFKKVSKDSKLFKKQLENSDDKRLFIDSNLDRFKQMKLQENFQSALNRNKAVINKLEKIPSTENVLARLGQLKAQREQILKKYFEVRETI